MNRAKAKTPKKGFRAAGRKPTKRRAIADEMAGMNPRAPQGMEPEGDEAMNPEALIGVLVNKLAAAGMSPEMIMSKLQELFGGAEGMGAPMPAAPSPGMPPGMGSPGGMSGMMAGMM